MASGLQALRQQGGTPPKQALKRSWRDHLIKTHFTDGQIGVQEEEGCAYIRSDRIPIQGPADRGFPAPAESQFDE